MKKSISEITKNISASIQKHSPEILTVTGVIGLVGAGVLAVIKTKDALKKIEEKKKDENVEKLTPIDTIKATWKCYIPAVSIGTASILCIIGANSMSIKREAVISAAYRLSDSQLKEYRKKVIEAIGENKEEQIRAEIAKERIEKNDKCNKEIIICGDDNVLCYDTISGRYIKSNIDSINKIVNELNHRMVNENYISLNDFYYELGLANIAVGYDLGWSIGNGPIEISYSSQIANDRPCIVLDYENMPSYDFKHNW